MSSRAWLVITVACAPAAPAAITNVSRDPPISVALDTATIAFHYHGKPPLPVVEDDRPCVADGPPWPAAEAAVATALVAQQHDRRVELRHIGFVRELDAYVATPPPRGTSTIRAAVHVTAAGGYLIAKGSVIGGRSYCFDVVRTARRITLVPRIVSMIDY
jgi:hypothetical protein